MLQDRLDPQFLQEPVGSVLPGAALARAERWQIRERPHWTPCVAEVRRCRRLLDGEPRFEVFFWATEDPGSPELLGTVAIEGELVEQVAKG